MKTLYLFIFLLIFTTGAHAQTDTITQVSTIDALLNGIYDGEITIDTLKKYGNIGIGTLEALDGELVAVDGHFYQVKSNGLVKQVDGSAKTPFATVTFFEADDELPLPAGMDLETVKSTLDEYLPTKNIFYAIRINGDFKKIKVRSVPRQQKPYKPLIDVIKKQSVFTLRNREGIMVGFRCPPFIQGINVPGYHFHFISKDTKSGGHVLDFKTERATLYLDHTPEFFMLLPNDQAFYDLNLGMHKEKDLTKIEK